LASILIKHYYSCPQSSLPEVRSFYTRTAKKYRNECLTYQVNLDLFPKGESFSNIRLTIFIKVVCLAG